MNPGFYLRYSTRSLARHGYRTVLALFCIAVGVMAIVSLQLAGLTIRHSLTSNVREANGGDIQMMAVSTGLGQDELAHLDDLERQRLVSAWTATLTPAATARFGSGPPRSVQVQVVDPTRYPLVGSVKIARPQGRDLRSLIGATGTALIGSTAQHQLGAGVGDQVQLATQAGSMTVTVNGLLADSGALSGGILMVGIDTLRASSSLPPLYNSVYVTTPGRSQMLQVAADLKKRYPVASVQTTDDVLKSQEEASRFISQFLDIVGLLALLVGGIGIANTMQVLLSRRRIEIAMLKTSGYRRRDLYLLFGLEAAWLGLAGGAVGALLGAVVSFAVTRLVENLVGQHLEPQLDPLTVLSGLAVGLATALTFGLLPIVRAAEVRPLAVIRETSEEGWGTRILTAVLLGVLGALFTLLAFVILGNLQLAVFGVAGTLVALGLMSLVFALVGFVIGVLPVPERVTWRHLLLVTPPVLISAVIAYLLPAVGVLLLLFTLAGYLIVLAPRSWKVTVKLGFRGVGRQPGRTATTLVALFVGVFCVGLILILAQDIRSKLNSAISNSATYNVIVIDSAKRADSLAETVPGTPGLKAQRKAVIMTATPVAIKNEPVADFATRARAQGGAARNPFFLSSLSSLEGSDLGAGRLPQNTLARDPTNPRHSMGRLLTPADAGTNNVVGGQELSMAPFNLRPGDTVTLAEPRTHEQRTLTLVGFFQRSFVTVQFGAIEADSRLVSAWAGDTAAVAYSLKIDPAHKAAAVRRLSDADPQAGVLDLADFGAIVDQILRNLLILLTSLASLALLAGAVIIANAVALAMLERRREIGIMKSVGYQSKSVLSQVLFENALLGGVGGLSAIAVVALATTLLGKIAFKTNLDVAAPLAVAIILASSLLASVVSALVAWAPTRVRPLEVLRYE
jgi:putative ABC transport system permease protein